MKYSEEKMNEYRSTMAVPERPEYPYGLCISLEEDQIKALEIVGTPPGGSGHDGHGACDGEVGIDS
jgi:hypothetical protein